jgi:hypothetical protein
MAMASSALWVSVFAALLSVGCWGSTSCQSGAKHGTTCRDEEGVVVHDDCGGNRERAPEVVEPDYIRH